MENGYATTEDGIKLHYHIIGEGAKTVVVPFKASLEYDIDPLASEQRLVLYDPRGRGGSDAVSLEKVSVEFDVRDIETLRQHLSLDRFSLMGHSYLSLVSALYAARYPEKIDRLVMVGVLPVRTLDDPEIEKAKQETYAARYDAEAMQQVNQLREANIDKTDPERFSREFWRVMFATNMTEPAVFERMASNPFRFPNEHPDRATEHLKRIFERLDTWDYRSQAKQITCPTLVVQGVHDLFPMKGVEEWTVNLPDARLMQLDDVAHFPWLEAPEPFFSAVNHFLQGQWPSASVKLTQ